MDNKNICRKIINDKKRNYPISKNEEEYIKEVIFLERKFT